MARVFKKGRLIVNVSENRKALGEIAAKEIGDYIVDLQQKKDEVNIVFASAPSQNEFLANLKDRKDIQWEKINAFHMDEYIGLAADAPQGFGNFLKDRIWDFIPLKSKNYMNGLADPQQECERYASLMRKMPVDIVFLGIGENGHLAFNDPHVAFFDDPLEVKVVDLAPECRFQQINDGCFKTLDEVPTHALTITIPELLKVKKLIAIVPSKAKANAIKATCDGPISTTCPASILRTHWDCTLYVDEDSAALVD